MIFNSSTGGATEISLRLQFLGAARDTSEAPPTTAQLAQHCGFDLHQLGAEAHGTILLFGQIHKSSLREDGIEMKLAIVDAQQKILDDLLRIRPERVFVEGLSVTQSSKDVLGEYSMSWERVLKSFSDYCPGRPLTVDQENLLLNSFAPDVYLALATQASQSVTLLPTATEEDRKRSSQADWARPSDRSWIMGEREVRVMKMVQQSLSEREGAVALIFGIGHQKNWPGACDSGFHPSIYSKDYSGFSSQIIRTPGETYALKLGRAQAAFEHLNDPNSWKEKNSLKSRQMLEHLVEALDIRATNIQAPNHHLMLSYVSDVNMADADRGVVINALAARLCHCDERERTEILLAFQKIQLLPQLVSDPRVARAIVLDKISTTQLLEKEDADVIVSDALLLPDEHCRAVLSALDIRGAFTRSEVERTSIDDALKRAKDYKRIPFSF